MDDDERVISVQNGRFEYAVDLLATLIVRAQAYVTMRRQAHGYPQLAIFSFDYIGARISAFGRYERDELEALIKFMRHKKLLNGGVCVDAGANIGNHALFFADHFAEVHAFEPAPRAFSLLLHNSGLKSNICCHNFGLSDHSHVANLTAPLYNIGRGSISIAIPEADLRVSSHVQLAPLDSVDVLASENIDLVKIDVEGHELAVLDGAAVLLANKSPAIVFEQQPEEVMEGSSATIDRLRAFGYQNFYTSFRTPQVRSRLLTIVLRLAFGERIRFVPVSVFEPKYYSMIVAVK